MRHQQTALFQRRQFYVRSAVKGVQRAVAEHGTHDARLLQAPLLLRRQVIQARLQHAGKGGRHARGEQPVGVKPPRLVGPIGLDRNLHDAFSAVIDEAQWDDSATSVGNRVEPMDFLAPAQQSSASLKDDAVLGEQVGDA